MCVDSRSLGKVKYALHPGFVGSKSDNDIHYITALELVRLYRIPIKECIVTTCTLGSSLKYPIGIIHLHPRKDGNYVLEDKRK